MSEGVVGSRIEPITHVVRRGENFWTIARKYYGSGRFYRALWRANLDVAPRIDELYVGTRLILPAPEDLDRAYIDPPRSNAPGGPAGGLDVGEPTQSFARRDDSARRSSAEIETDTPRRQPPKARRVHIVRPNETLRSIARKVLGDSRREQELLELNADLIENPPHVEVGTPLRLPEK